MSQKLCGSGSRALVLGPSEAFCLTSIQLDHYSHLFADGVFSRLSCQSTSPRFLFYFFYHRVLLRIKPFSDLVSRAAGRAVVVSDRQHAVDGVCEQFLEH